MSGTPEAASSLTATVWSVGVVEDRVRDWVASESTRVQLEEGHAEHMGDGMFVVFQTIGERTFSVTLSRDDLAKMIDVA